MEISLILILLVLTTAFTRDMQHPLKRPVTGFFSEPRKNNVVVVDGQFFGDPPGGVEALIQLSLAIAEALEDSNQSTSPRSFVSQATYHDRYKVLYGDRLIKRIKMLHQLKSGDIFITSEGVECPQGFAKGVIIYVWLLADYIGCRDKDIRYIVHNKYLSHFTYQNVKLSLPRESIVHPYVSVPIIERAISVAGLEHDGSIYKAASELREMKKNTLLIDNDVPFDVLEVLKQSAEAAGGQYIFLDGLDKEGIMKAYEEGKIVVDWCMRGSERCPLEASLFGAISVTNNCSTGRSFADFPIPSKFHLSDEQMKAINSTELKEKLTPLFADIFANYWDYVDDYEPLRRSILEHNPLTMLKDTIRFLASIDV